MDSLSEDDALCKIQELNERLNSYAVGLGQVNYSVFALPALVFCLAFTLG